MWSSSFLLNNNMEISSRTTGMLPRVDVPCPVVWEVLRRLVSSVFSASWRVSDAEDPIHCSCGFEKLERYCCPHRASHIRNSWPCPSLNLTQNSRSKCSIREEMELSSLLRPGPGKLAQCPFCRNLLASTGHSLCQFQSGRG